MFAWLASLVSSGILKALGDNIIAPIIAQLKAKSDAELSKALAQTGADKERAIAALQLEASANAAKLEVRKQEGKWGPTLVAGLALFALPAGLHFWAVTIDSICGMWGGVVGSWHIATLGNLHETEQVIIQSFFIVGGAASLATIAARAFGRSK